MLVGKAQSHTQKITYALCQMMRKLHIELQVHAEGQKSGSWTQLGTSLKGQCNFPFVSLWDSFRPLLQYIKV